MTSALPPVPSPLPPLPGGEGKIGIDARTLIGLVEQYSPTGEEKAAVTWLVERMRQLGYSQSFVDGAGNAVGVMGAGPRQAILLGHIDTVTGLIPVLVEGDLLYGRGSVDAKGPLAAFVDAVARIGVQSPSLLDGWQLVVIGAVNEEGDSLGARHITPLYHPEFAIIGEPSRWERVTLGYKGSAWARLTVRQARSHTASPTASACEKAVAAWETLRGWADKFNAGRERAFDQLLLGLRGLESGEGDFEEWASLRVGARLPLDLPAEAWYIHLAEILPGIQIEPYGFPIPAYACEKNTPLVRAFLAAIRTQGGKPGFLFKTGTADLNIVGPVWNCPAVVYGPGDSALDHTPQEHASLGEYLQAVEVLVQTLKQMLR